MKFTLSWLKRFIRTNSSTHDIVDALNKIGLEVESITDKSEEYKGFKVAEIKARSQHPDADKLSVCTVYDGKEMLQIVCGAPNARAGIKVVLAEIGAVVPNGKFAIKKSKIRGVESCGMLCSAGELLLSSDSDGIIELPSDAIVGCDFASYQGLDDVLIDISITPNRGDCASVIGIARDLAAFGLGELHLDNKEDIVRYGSSNISIEIQDKNFCREFYGAYVKNLNVCSTPDYERTMRAIGSSKKLPLVDISNFIMFSYGRPNHIYDADKIEGNIVVRSAKDGERFIAIGGEEYSLSSDVTVIADDVKILSVAGVIGGETSKVTEHTKNIFVEMANFDPSMVAKSGRYLNIITDSRFRFERRIDHGNTDYVFGVLLKDIQKYCGGEISENIISYGNKHSFIESINFDYKKVNKLLGTNFTEKECYDVFLRLGFKCQDGTVNIPSWRQGDIKIEEDLIEEVVRIKGYETIPSLLLDKPDTFFLSKNHDAIHVLRNRGVSEVISWSFASEAEVNIFGGSGIKLKNPISIELMCMRPSGLIHIIKFAANHINRGSKNVSMFEMGPIYNNLYEQKQVNSLCGIRTGGIGISPHKETREFDFFDIKADLFAVLESYNINTDILQISTDCPRYYHPTQSASFKIGKSIVAYCGAIHPSVLKEFGIDQKLFAFEIFLDNLPKTKYKFRTYNAVSNLQPIVRDFAFLVDKTLSASQLEKTIRGSDSNIASAKIFDVYWGKGVEDGKKSMAVSVVIEQKEKTMTDAEIDSISDAIIASCEAKLSAALRR